MTVVLGYTIIESSPPCPYCGGKTYMIEDDGDHPWRHDSYKVRCWCGATARVSKDDPDLVKLLSRGRALRGET